MSQVPLPASPCVRVALDYTKTDGTLAGSRFYLSYTGSAPTAANCATLATDVATEWNTTFGTMVNPEFALTEVDVLDIATEVGASGNWQGSHAGQNAGSTPPGFVAVNIQFVIARRYRGGKPRMYLPPGIDTNMSGPDMWSPTFAGDAVTQAQNFFGYLHGLSIGAMGVLQHVNVSYYKGFKNFTNSSGREYAAPTYRDTATVDPVTGYIGRQLVSSQRRRRSASTY